MSNTQAISDILVMLSSRQDEYQKGVEILLAEHDEFHELIELYPLLDSSIDDCAEEVLKEYIQLKGRLSAIERLINRIRKDEGS